MKDDSPARLEPFVLLDDPSSYVACTWDLWVDVEAREYWVPFFKKHLEVILGLGLKLAAGRGEPGERALDRAESCRREFHRRFDEFAAAARGGGFGTREPVTILTLDRWRDEILRSHGFVDPFSELKERDNALAAPLLPRVCRELDALPADQQARAVIEGLFAGNIFDMGAAATAAKLMDGTLDFFHTRSRLPVRPWLIDDLDRAVPYLEEAPRRVVFFIDNAGSDFLLGAVPMMRWLCQRGGSVVLAANARPTLNDMTIDDVNQWWPKIIEIEPSLANLAIERVSTGTGEPLIDLLGVSPELNRASANADLVILEGMGRGIESNLDARFRCPALNLGMIKDEMIAKVNGGRLFDVVCRFRTCRDAVPPR